MLWHWRKCWRGKGETLNNILSIFNCLALFLSSISENCRAAFAQHNFVPPCQTLSLIIQVEFRNHSLPVLDGLFGPATRLSTAIVICVLGASRQPIRPICSHLSIQGNHSRNLRTKDVGRDAKSCYGDFLCSHHSWDPHERWCKLDISLPLHNVPCKSQDEKTAGQRGSEDPGRCGICGGPGLPWICGSWVQCRHHGAWKLIRNKCWRSCFQCPFKAFTTWTAFTNRLSECFRCFVRPPSSTIRNIEFLVGEERDWAKLEATAAVSLRQQNRKLLVWRYIYSCFSSYLPCFFFLAMGTGMTNKRHFRHPRESKCTAGLWQFIY